MYIYFDANSKNLLIGEKVLERYSIFTHKLQISKCVEKYTNTCIESEMNKHNINV